MGMGVRVSFYFPATVMGREVRVSFYFLATVNQNRMTPSLPYCEFLTVRVSFSGYCDGYGSEGVIPFSSYCDG